MTINQLTVFAQNGEKNTTGLTQADGFPSTQKPARQWFNFLLNTITVKINEIINEKADKNGNPLQRFKVNSAVDDDEAVNKWQLTQAQNNQFNSLYPVGIVLEFGLDANPNHLWPSTTWVRFSEGQVTVGYQNGDSDFGVIGQTGGKKGHKMTTSNLIAHLHRIKEGGAAPSVGGAYTSGDDVTNNIWGEVDSGSTGQTDPDAIPTLPPYVVTAKWTRTA